MLKLSMLFSDHMILQADKPIRVYGKADGSVTVSLAGVSVTVPSENGSFLAVLPAMNHGGPYTMTCFCGMETVTLSDVCIGEVILCAGQSNMQMRVRECNTPESEWTDDDHLRTVLAELPAQGEPIPTERKWICAKKGNIGNWSAVGWLLGRRIRAEGIPYVGIVVCTQGASNIQAWIDEKKIVGTELDLPYEILHIDAKKEEYYWNRPGYLYHRLFEPYCPYTFGNAVWYQGESNAGEEYVHYLDLLTCMISLWRERDLDPDLPFTIVQIADFNGWWVTPACWAGIQKAQEKAEMTIPNLHTVRCADLSDIEQIHPVNKAPLADRLFASMRKYGTI